MGGAIAPGSNVATYLWSLVSTRIVYRANQETNGQFALYLATPAGTTQIKISGPLIAAGTVSKSAWAP